MLGYLSIHRTKASICFLYYNSERIFVLVKFKKPHTRYSKSYSVQDRRRLAFVWNGKQARTKCYEIYLALKTKVRNIPDCFKAVNTARRVRLFGETQSSLFVSQKSNARRRAYAKDVPGIVQKWTKLTQRSLLVRITSRSWFQRERRKMTTFVLLELK